MKKKVMHILSSNQYSGAENVAATIIENINDKTETVYVSPKGPVEEILRNKGVEFLGIENMNVFDIRKAIKTWEPDIIHAHDFRSSILSSFATLFIPIVSHIHQNPRWLAQINIKSFLYFISCLKYKKIILVSRSIYEQNKFMKLFSDKIAILENMIDIESITRKATNINTEFYDIAFLGRLEDIKDPLRLIDIIEKIVEVKDDFKAVIIGDGTLKTQCKKRIYKKKLQNNIDMKGFQTNPYPFLMNSKLLVITSKSEGRPMAALEAMALGKPIVTSDFKGVKKLINKTNGRISYNNQDFIDNILYFLDYHISYSLFSNNVKKYAKKQLDITAYIESISRIYDEL